MKQSYKAHESTGWSGKRQEDLRTDPKVLLALPRLKSKLYIAAGVFAAPHGPGVPGPNRNEVKKILLAYITPAFRAGC